MRLQPERFAEAFDLRVGAIRQGRRTRGGDVELRVGLAFRTDGPLAEAFGDGQVLEAFQHLQIPGGPLQHQQIPGLDGFLGRGHAEERRPPLDGHHREARALTPLTAQPTLLAHLFQFAANLAQAPLNLASVDFELCLTGATQAYTPDFSRSASPSTGLTCKMGPRTG